MVRGGRAPLPDHRVKARETLNAAVTKVVFPDCHPMTDAACVVVPLLRRDETVPHMGNDDNTTADSSIEPCPVKDGRIAIKCPLGGSPG